MSLTADERASLDLLSDSEQAAVRAAAVWYFKRHARIIADEADDPSVAAVARRDDFVELHGALRKLGVPVALPDELSVRV
jgi:hypothetical protein